MTKKATAKAGNKVIAIVLTQTNTSSISEWSFKGEVETNSTFADIANATFQGVQKLVSIEQFTKSGKIDVQIKCSGLNIAFDSMKLKEMGLKSANRLKPTMNEKRFTSLVGSMIEFVVNYRLTIERGQADDVLQQGA